MRYCRPCVLHPSVHRMHAVQHAYKRSKHFVKSRATGMERVSSVQYALVGRYEVLGTVSPTEVPNTGVTTQVK